MSRNIVFAEKEFYHLYNRGVDKRTVFESESDQKRFALLLYLCNGTAPVRFEHLPFWKHTTSSELIVAAFEYERGEPLIALGTYCLMPNHFHLLAREITENGISTFMQKLSTAYTMYFNFSRKRTGALFQGRYKAEHANSDNYLKYLFSYIHLNPVKRIEPAWKEKGIKDLKRTEGFLATFPYSSYLDYTGTKRDFSRLLTRDQFPEYFSTATSFKQCLRDWLTYKDDFRAFP